MSFLAPILLAGIAAVGLPIALHFLFKAWYRPLPWAAMDFLRKSLEQTTRRIKFREFILLLLRCTCLLLLSLALARPVIGWLAGTGENDSIDAVFVIDTSYSMAAKDGNSTRFEKAKLEALAVIDDLPNNSTVQVIGCSDRATVHKFTPSNLDQARNVVRGLTLTSQTSDLGPGLTEAEAALDRVQGANKEIHIFSDFQRNTLEGGAASKLNDLKGRSRLILTRCTTTTEQLKNVTVQDIKFPDSIPPHAGTRLPFTVILKNTGNVPVLNVAVTLTVDGQSKQNEQLIDTGIAPEIAPGATFPVTMTAALPRAGYRLLTATVGVPKTDGVSQNTVSQPDDIPGDNRFDKLVLVRQSIRVLIVEGRPDPREPKDGSAHFVRNAIVPVSTGQKDEYFLRATTITTDQLANEKLADYQIVVLTNVPANAEDKVGIASLEKKTIEQLQIFVANGGGLVIGVGDFVLAESYNRELKALLPFQLEKPIKAPPGAPYHPSPDRIENPSFLSRIRDEPFSSTFATVDVNTVIPAKEQSGDPGRVIARLDNNAVLISSRMIGQGEVVCIHTSLDTTWTNWPAKATPYVGSILFLLTHLSGKTDVGGNVVSGAKLSWVPKESTRDYEVQKPDGSRSKLASATATQPNGKPTLVISDTSVAGEYQIQVQGLNDEEAPKFAVIPDLRESERLDTMNDADVTAKIGFAPFFRQAGMKNDLVENIRNQREWTVPVLVVLLLFLLVEGTWAWYCGRAV